MDDHRELRLFLHLAQTLNFGRTSLDCHVSPATLTRTVQRLEAELGHRLFDRGPRGVSLTAQGHRFREYAVQALELWRAYREEHPDPAELTGRLAVFATVTACQALLPDLLAPFRAVHPRGTGRTRSWTGRSSSRTAGSSARRPTAGSAPAARSPTWPASPTGTRGC